MANRPCPAGLPLLLALLPTVLGAGPAAAQARFRTPEWTGPTLAAGKVGSDLERGWFVDGLWSVPHADVGFTYAEVERGARSDGGPVVYGDLDTQSFTPHLSVQFLTPSATSPVGFDLVAAHTWSRLGGDAVDALERAAGEDMTARGLRVGGELYLKLDDMANLVAYPSLGLHFLRATVSLAGVDTRTVDHATVARLSLVLYRHFLLDPQLEVVDDETRWSVAFGAMYP